MLRWRLLVGLISIFVLLLAVGGYGIWLVSRLEEDIHSILKGNYESIREAHQIRLTMLRLNAAYFRPGVADVVRVGPEPLDGRYEPSLEKTLAALRLLAHSERELGLVNRLRDQVQAYLARFREMLSLPPDAQDRYNELRADLLRRNVDLSQTTEDILRLKESGMIDAQNHATVVAGDTVRFLVAAMIAAAAVFIYTYHRLGRSLIRPIEELTHSIEAVQARRFEQSLPVKSNDELGHLASAFNAMAGQLRTYQRETDETILRLNRSVRETLAAFPYPVVLLNAEDEIWVTNQAADSLLKNLGNSDELPEPLRRQLAAVRQSHTDYLPQGLGDALLFRVSEREVHYLPRILRIFSPEGEVSGAAVILIDVSRFRWLDDMKTNLISTISHEIKTPLTGIRMILHLLREKTGGDLTPMQEEMVQASCDDCERLLTTLNSLLDLSRMEGGRPQLELVPLDPADLLHRVCSAFQTQAQTRGIHLAVETAGEIPPVLADSARMMHVIGNFVSNALKFAPEKSTVHLVADQTGPESVRLSVIDAGPGVAPECQSRVFDKFFRSPGHRAEGVGLGLSIAREIVHAHDGRIGVQSTPHVATRFYCELPIASSCLP